MANERSVETITYNGYRIKVYPAWTNPARSIITLCRVKDLLDLGYQASVEDAKRTADWHARNFPTK